MISTGKKTKKHKASTPAELLKIQKSNLERKGRGLRIFNEKALVRSKVREHGRKALKQGTHPQMWRARGPGGKLGPMGEMGEDVILEVTFIPGKLIKLGPSGPVKDIIASLKRSIETNFARGVHRPLEELIISKINTWVPMDTGNLRKQMIAVTYNASATVDGMKEGKTYRMTAGTPGVKYASVVNKMPVTWLKHPAGYHRNIGRQKDPLNDPLAKEGWYDLTVLNARNKAKQLFPDFLTNTVVPILKPLEKIRGSGIKSAHNYARTLFTVKYL